MGVAQAKEGREVSLRDGMVFGEGILFLGSETDLRKVEKDFLNEKGLYSILESKS
jgi:hypothetical protein